MLHVVLLDTLCLLENRKYAAIKLRIISSFGRSCNHLTAFGGSVEVLDGKVRVISIVDFTR